MPLCLVLLLNHQTQSYILGWMHPMWLEWWKRAFPQRGVFSVIVHPLPEEIALFTQGYRQTDRMLSAAYLN
jgi:hypothetical protein